MNGKSYGTILTEGFVRAIPWAIVFSVAWLLTFHLTMDMLRQNVKETIEYSAKTGVSQAVDVILAQNIWPKIKQNTKEAIEYTVTAGGRKPAAQSQSRK
jgi:hypothetical protein